MFARTKSPSQLLLESELAHALRALKSQDPGSEQYVKTLDSAVKIYDMMDKKPSSVSKDTLVVVGANLLGIAMIIKHEFLNPITSKALSFVIRPR